MKWIFCLCFVTTGLVLLLIMIVIHNRKIITHTASHAHRNWLNHTNGLGETLRERNIVGQWMLGFQQLWGQLRQKLIKQINNICTFFKVNNEMSLIGEHLCHCCGNGYDEPSNCVLVNKDDWMLMLAWEQSVPTVTKRICVRSNELLFLFFIVCLFVCFDHLRHNVCIIEATQRQLVCGGKICQ